jgi:hypothetical protein
VQLLNQPGLANPENLAATPGRVTLSSTALIAFE